MWIWLNVNISTKHLCVLPTNSLHESILNIRTFKPSFVRQEDHSYSKYMADLITVLEAFKTIA